MSTARTTPAQKPRGRTRRSTFPLVSVGIFFLSQWFIKTLSYLRAAFVGWKLMGGGLPRREGGFGPSAALGIKKPPSHNSQGGAFGAGELAVTVERAECGCGLPRWPASTS